MNLIFENQLSIFEDIFYKYLTPKQCIKLYSSNLILYNIYNTNNKFESNYYTPKDKDELKDAVYKWCKNKEEAILKYGNINYWNIIYITNMEYLFKDKYRFNDDISDWNTSNVTDIAHMFSHTRQFNQDISNWNTSNIKNMRFMFYKSTNFNQDISNWDISNVIDMSCMFYKALRFKNKPIWNIDNILCNTCHMYSYSAIK